MRRFLCAVFVLSVVASMNAKCSAAEPGWSPVIIATGDFRRKIQSTPIEHRPYRPLHIYGNTIRRMHHRGTPLPVPRTMAPTQVIRNFRGFR